MAELSTQKRRPLRGLSTQKRRPRHAETPTTLIKSLYPPIAKDTCSRSFAFWGQPCGLPPLRLAPTRNSRLKKARKPYAP